MHETSIARSLLGQVLEIAAENGATVVDRVILRVGEFSGVDPVLLLAAFERAIPETAAARAELRIEHVPLRARCRDCDASFAPSAYRFVCPGCGSQSTEVQQGAELTLVAVEVSQEAGAPCF